MTRVRLNPLDAAWILTESRATPNHVGGLLQFRLPDGAPRDFLRQLMAEFRAHQAFAPPWNRHLQRGFSLNPVPTWVEDDDVDLEYHIRHAALPWPGGERELGELVGRLQSTPLDLSRPPWECTLIEGLSDHRFALFVKMHHALIDGISGMRLLQRAMSTDRAKSLQLPPFWATGTPRTARTGAAPTLAGAMAVAAQALSEQVKSVPQLIAAFGKMARRVGDGDAGLALPFDAPRSVLNGRVREKRRFATQQFSLERLRAVAKAGGGTLNDVVLAISGGALRHFLQERASLPAKPLTAGIPVSVRPQDDEGTGNAISFIIATLGTDIADARARFEAIKNSVRQAKAHVQALPRQAMTQYTVLLMAPTILTLLTGMGGRTRPMFNVTISNVPGPDKPLYFRGAELLAIYPVSIVTHGQAVNITCQSYAGSMNFGFTGCHASLPSLQRLAVYAADALQALEAALLPPAALAQPKPKRIRAAAKPGADTTVPAPAAVATPRKVTARTAPPAPAASPAPRPRRRKSATA